MESVVSLPSSEHAQGSISGCQAFVEVPLAPASMASTACAVCPAGLTLVPETGSPTKPGAH